MSDENVISGERLIELLMALTPEQRQLPVYSEGCDCYGEAKGIAVQDDFILVERL
jgi:hypothetical protein